ncbi:MAG: hypothetical protein KDC49_01890 [Saprospiraceae bacterium]|nr:hypothetical protein [Saprospiraceae bacterium]
MMKKITYSLAFLFSIITLMIVCKQTQNHISASQQQRQIMQEKSIDATDLFYRDSETGMAASRKYFGH